MAHLRGARASFLCVTETESMATVCPRVPTAPQVAVTYMRPTSDVRAHELADMIGAPVTTGRRRLGSGRAAPATTGMTCVHDLCVSST